MNKEILNYISKSNLTTQQTFKLAIKLTTLYDKVINDKTIDLDSVIEKDLKENLTEEEKSKKIGLSIIKTLPVIFDKYEEDVYSILAIVSCVEVEEVKQMKIAEVIDKLFVLVTGKDMIDFFQLSEV